MNMDAPLSPIISVANRKIPQEKPIIKSMPAHNISETDTLCHFPLLLQT